MKLSLIHIGDVVQCNVRGRVFDAEVADKTDKGVQIIPPANNQHHHVRARQIERIVSRAPRRS